MSESDPPNRPPPNYSKSLEDAINSFIASIAMEEIEVLKDIHIDAKKPPNVLERFSGPPNAFSIQDILGICFKETLDKTIKQDLKLTNKLKKFEKIGLCSTYPFKGI